MTSGWVLGIDVGTSSVKVVVLDEAGRLIEAAAHHHGIIEDDHRVEVDPERWWDSLGVALARLTIPLDRVVALGLSGNMSSVVLVDEGFAPLRHAILLADTRGSEQLAALGDELTGRIVESTGNIPETVFSLASLLWLRDHEPEILDRTHAVVTSKDFLLARLTGHLATDPTDAGNTLLLRDAEWDAELISALGLPRNIFPPLRLPGSFGGTVTEQAAARTGLPVGIPVAVGAGDVAAALVGCGGLSPRRLAVSVGTSTTLMAGMSGQSIAPAALGKLTVHTDAESGWFALGSLLTGGLALNWLRGLFGPDALTAARDVPLDSQLVFLPYLAGTGSPDFIAEMRGTFYGLTPATAPHEMVAALMQAVAFDLAELIENLDVDYDEVVLSGGGSRLAAWPQTLADVLELPVTLFDAPDLSAVGAALLAWRYLGVDVAFSETSGTVLPRRELRQQWRERRRLYCAARAAAVEFYTTLQEETERNSSL